MYHREKWPFVPVRLSAIIDKETLSVIEAGCAERFGRALTIIDYDAEHQFARRTDPLNPHQNNAIKYSFPNTRIIVRAMSPRIGKFDFDSSMLEIQNEGNEIVPIASLSQ